MRSECGDGAAQQQDVEQQHWQACMEQQAAHCPGGGIRHRNDDGSTIDFALMTDCIPVLRRFAGEAAAMSGALTSDLDSRTADASVGADGRRNAGF